MINGMLPVIVWGKRVTRLQNKTILRACEVRSQCISFALPRSLKLSLSHSLVLHIVLRISLVLPVFLLHPTAKIWRDFSTSSPSLILRKLRLSFTKLYIFYKLKNVQSIVDRRNWTRMNYFQTTWPWWRRRRHRSWALRIAVRGMTKGGNSSGREIAQIIIANMGIELGIVRVRQIAGGPITTVDSMRTKRIMMGRRDNLNDTGI